MAATTTTPYMSLVLPTVGTQVGPTWASELNTAFTSVDSHTHVTGQGQPIPTAGISINADLSFNTSYNLTTVRTVRPVNQTAALALASDVNCIYVAAGDLYYNDVSGNQVRITASGAVNTAGSGNITGMGGTTATVTYSNASKRFTFLSATSTPAYMTCGPITMGLNAASPKTVTITLDGGQAADYTMTLPVAVPASSGYLQMDTAGALSVQGVVVPGTSNGLVSMSGLPGSTAGSALAAGYVGQVIWGPANKNTGSLTATGSSGAWTNFQSIALTAGVWLVFANFQVQANDNSTAFSTSTSIDFVISATTASGTGVYGFACIDYNSLYLSNANNNPGNIGAGTISTVVTPGSTTTYYLNGNITYTGATPKGRGGMMAVRIA